jgi:hypothetical protein
MQSSQIRRLGANGKSAQPLALKYGFMEHISLFFGDLLEDFPTHDLFMGIRRRFSARLHKCLFLTAILQFSAHK